MMALDAYFDHIGFDGERVPTLDVLRQLHLRHTQAIPFENLSPLLRQGVPLDIPSLLDKFTRQGRGGYCFEHNVLFRHVLESIGFRTRALSARVRWNVPDDRTTPRTHSLLLLEIDGDRYIADTGFGGLTLTAPLRLAPDIEQDTPHGSFRLLLADEVYTLQGKVGSEWKTTYVFDLQPQVLADYELTSWYLSNHPQSHFLTNLLAAKPAPDGRHALRNNSYTFYGLDGRQEKKTIGSVNELKELLEHHFHIRVPALPGVDDKLDQMRQQDVS